MTMMRQVLCHREMAAEPRMLKHAAQPPPYPGRLAREIMPENPRAPRLNRRERREQLEERALAAAVGPEKTEKRAARNGETNAREPLAIAIAKAEPARLDRWRSNARRTVSKFW